MSSFQERRALSFTFLEFEQVDIWSLSMGVRAALQAGQECLRGEHPRGVSWSAFRQPREMNPFPREEGVISEWLMLVPVPVFCTGTDVLPTSGNGTCCISSLLYSTWLSRVCNSAQSRAWSDKHFSKWKHSAFFRSWAISAAGWPTLPTCLAPLVSSSIAGNSERGLSLCCHRPGHCAGTCLCCASAAGLIHCFWGCSHPSFSALAGMQTVVHFLHLPTVSLLFSASGPGTIRYFSSVL